MWQNPVKRVSVERPETCRLDFRRRRRTKRPMFSQMCVSTLDVYPSAFASSKCDSTSDAARAKPAKHKKMLEARVEGEYEIATWQHRTSRSRRRKHGDVGRLKKKGGGSSRRWGPCWFWTNRRRNARPGVGREAGALKPCKSQEGRVGWTPRQDPVRENRCKNSSHTA